MNLKSAKHYYAKDTWDVDAWVDVIAVEYETLIEKYPFDEKLRSFSKKGTLTVLDVGCGTAIFPSYLDKALSGDIHLSCDLLDISASSLEQARRVLGSLEHFSANRIYESLIEDVPITLSRIDGRYDVIWAIHSFTTVDVEKMMAVYAHLLDLLTPSGCLFIYQLAAKSAYQKFHGSYRAHHPHGKDSTPFMEYEDTQRMLNSLGVKYEVHELFFYHEVDDDSPDLLESYLRKSILDDSVDVLKFFESILQEFHDRDSNKYRIPQFVNFVAASK